MQNKFYDVSDKIIICANIPDMSCLNFTCDESDVNKQSLLFLLISIIFIPAPHCSPNLGQTTEGTPFSGLGPVPMVASQSRRKRSSASTVGFFAASCHKMEVAISGLVTPSGL